MRIYVLHATEYAGVPFLSGPRRLSVAYGYDVDTPMQWDLETIFRENNAVDGNERNVEQKARSLSVGDVVLRDDGATVDAHVVDIAGFLPMPVSVLPALLGWIE